MKLFLKSHIFFITISVIISIILISNYNYDGVGDWNDFAELAAIGRYFIYSFQQFPLWDPYGCGGVDLLSHPEINYFSPFFIFVVFFGVPLGMKLNIIAHIVIGYIGFFKLCLKLDFAKRAASLSSITFILSGFFISHIGEGHYTFLSMFYLPWIFYAFSLKQKYAFTVNFVLLYCLFSSGSPNFIIFSLIIYIVLLIQKLLNKEVSFIYNILHSTFLALCSSLFIFIPQLKTISALDRSQPYDHFSLFELIKSFINTPNRINDVSPGIWGNHEYINYLSPLTILVSIIGLLYILRKKINLVFVVVFLIGAILSLGSLNGYGLFQLIKMIPLIGQIRVPSRFIILSLCAIPIFFGYGMQLITQRFKRFENIIYILSFLIITISSTSLFRYLDNSWIKTKDISSLNSTKRENKNSFSQSITSTYLYVEEKLAPNRGILNCQRPQVIKQRRHYKQPFINKVDAEIKNWTPNHFTIVSKTSKPIFINMHCNNLWSSSHGSLTCFENHFLLKRTKPGQSIKIEYDSTLFNCLFILAIISFLRFLILRKRKSHDKN